MIHNTLQLNLSVLHKTGYKPWYIMKQSFDVVDAL